MSNVELYKSKIFRVHTEKDKEGLLDTFKKLLEIGSSMTSITTELPNLIEMVTKKF